MLLGKIILSYALTLEINFYAQIIGGRLIILQFTYLYNQFNPNGTLIDR